VCVIFLVEWYCRQSIRRSIMFLYLSEGGRELCRHTRIDGETDKLDKLDEMRERERLDT